MVQIASTPAGTIRNLPSSLLARLSIGQQIEVTVAKAVMATEKIMLNIGNTVLELQTPVDLQPGQRIRLELVREEGKAVLKWLPGTENSLKRTMAAAVKNIPAPELQLTTLLQAGQQFPIQIVKLLAPNTLLVQLAGLSGQTAPQFEIDVSQLKQTFRAGDTGWVKIVNTQPLQLQFLPQKQSAPLHIIEQAWQRLAPDTASLQHLPRLLSATEAERFPAIIREAIARMMGYTLTATEITESSRLKQALMSSGVLMEKTLLNRDSVPQTDFKANLNKVLQALETVIQGMKGRIEQAGLSTLPSQVQQALHAKGKTPAQLLETLLSGHRLASATTLARQSLAPAIKNPAEAFSLAQLMTKPFTLVQDQADKASRKALTLGELMQLFKEVEGVQHKVVSNQLQMLRSADQSPATLYGLFDLLIRNKQDLDRLQLQIERHQKKVQAQDDSVVWSVKLRLDTRNLGPVQANIILHDQKVNLILKAERRHSAQLLNKHRDVLQLSMQKLGISMSQFCCYCAPVAAAAQPPASENRPFAKQGLVDIRI